MVSTSRHLIIDVKSNNLYTQISASNAINNMLIDYIAKFIKMRETLKTIGTYLRGKQLQVK